MPALMKHYDLGRDQVSMLYRSIADAMYRAVRAGGLPCTALPWQWGFGWPRCDKAQLGFVAINIEGGNS